MSQISRPMQIVLGATLLLFAVWFVALRPKPATEGEAPAPAPVEQPASSGAAPGTDGLTSAIDQARDAAGTDDGDDVQTGGAMAGSDRDGSSASDGSARVSSAPIQTRGPVASVRAALRLNKAITIAFVDSATADSRAVDRELLNVSRFGGRAFTISVPLANLADYAFITNTVEVTVAPTVVIVDPLRRATTIVGATDRGEIEQRLADALAAAKRR